MRRQEILDAARAVFAQKGYNAATLDDVAERAEFGKGTLYNYFPNKEALFISVIEDTFETMKGIAEDAFSGDGSLQQKVEKFVRGELNFFFRNLESVHLMMREAHHIREGHSLIRLMPQLLKIVAASIASEQKKRKVIQGAEPMDMAMILMNMLFGQFITRIHRKMNALGDEVETAFCEVNLTTMFAKSTNEEIEQDVDAASRLIQTVFFQGIERK